MEKLRAETAGPANQEKRFVLSKEEFAQKRIAALKDTVKELQEEDSRVLSFTMFGSMARGNPKLGSDIDGYLYVEVPTDDTSESPELGKYTQEFTEKMIAKSDMKAEQVQQGLKVEAINEQILARDVQAYFDQKAAYQLYEKEQTDWMDSHAELEIEKDMAGNDQERASEYLKKLIEHERSRPEAPPFPRVNERLYGMFHLDVGGGIGKYRTKLIEDLSRRGQEGEEIWGKIVQGTEGMENHLRSTKKHYARTLAEARSVYETPRDRNDKM